MSKRSHLQFTLFAKDTLSGACTQVYEGLLKERAVLYAARKLRGHLSARYTAWSDDPERTTSIHCEYGIGLELFASELREIHTVKAARAWIERIQALGDRVFHLHDIRVIASGENHLLGRTRTGMPVALCKKDSRYTDLTPKVEREIYAAVERNRDYFRVTSPVTILRAAKPGEYERTSYAVEQTRI